VIQRVRKAAGEKERWDHDWVRSIAVVGDAETVKRFFAGRSGRKEAQETAIENVYVGAIQWLEENSKKPENIDYRFHFARMAGWVAMAEGHLDGTAFYKGGDADIAARSNETMESNIAREAGFANHGDWTVRQHRNKARMFLDMVEPNFFRLFRGKTGHKEDKEALGKQARDYLNEHYPTYSEKWNTIREIDNVYNNIDFITKVFMSNEYMSEERLMYIINAMRV
jgi:hypothetical protein